MTEIRIVQVPESKLESIMIQALQKFERQKALLKENEKFYNKKQAAAMLDMVYNTLQDKIDRGLIEERIDGKISEREIERFRRTKKE